MRKGKEELKNELLTARLLIEKTMKELDKAEETANGEIRASYTSEYSLEKIKRNCTVARECLLNVRKGLEWKE